MVANERRCHFSVGKSLVTSSLGLVLHFPTHTDPVMIVGGIGPFFSTFQSKRELGSAIVSVRTFASLRALTKTITN
jgi:hypothetical protein